MISAARDKPILILPYNDPNNKGTILISKRMEELILAGKDIHKRMDSPQSAETMIFSILFLFAHPDKNIWYVNIRIIISANCSNKSFISFIMVLSPFHIRDNVYMIRHFNQNTCCFSLIQRAGWYPMK